MGETPGLRIAALVERVKRFRRDIRGIENRFEVALDGRDRSPELMGNVLCQLFPDFRIVQGLSSPQRIAGHPRIPLEDEAEEEYYPQREPEEMPVRLQGMGEFGIVRESCADNQTGRRNERRGIEVFFVQSLASPAHVVTAAGSPGLQDLFPAAVIAQGLVVLGQIVINDPPVRTDERNPERRNAMIGEIPVDVQFIREEQNDRFPQMHVVVLQPLVEKGDLVRFFPVMLIEDEGNGERGENQQDADQQLILEG